MINLPPLEDGISDWLMIFVKKKSWWRKIWRGECYIAIGRFHENYQYRRKTWEIVAGGNWIDSDDVLWWLPLSPEEHQELLANVTASSY